MPNWLLVTEDYRPTVDREAFLARSVASLVSVVARVRPGEPPTAFDGWFHPVLKLASCLGWVLLVSLSTTGAWVAIAATVFALLVAARPARQIVSLVGTLGVVCGFSAPVLLPAVFLGHGATALSIGVKSLLSVGFVKLLSLSTPWDALFGALGTLRVPGVFVLVLDLTLKYIHILGEMALDLLSALRLRSVGRNPRKVDSLAAVVGVLYLKSRDMAQEVYHAMVCRGFTGDYRARRTGFSWGDGGLIAVHAALVVLFVVVEVRP